MPSKKPAKGREAVFRGKVQGYRVQGVLTKRGGQAFNAKRKELSGIYAKARGRVLSVISDADVIEYMARGREDTEVYLSLQGLQRVDK